MRSSVDILSTANPPRYGVSADFIWVAEIGARCPTIQSMASEAREERVESRTRNPKWQPAPLRIDMEICINCDACLRACPPQFGAIFNHGMDVIIIPELCSGCGKCLPPVCPVNCIIVDTEWSPAEESWWVHPLGSNDPYK